MFDISYYTNIIKCEEMQSMIDAYESVFLIVSSVFFIIGIVLIIRQKLLLRESKRRITDFLSDTDFQKPRRFLKRWNQIEKLIKKEKYREAINESNDLTFKILKRFSYNGDDLQSLIDKNEINEKVLPNIENIKEMLKLSEDNIYKIDKEQALKIFELYKDTLIKINILDQ